MIPRGGHAESPPNHIPPLWLQTAVLLELQRKSPGGVIELDTQLFEELVVGKSRPYSLIVIAGAQCGLTGYV